MGLAAAEIEEHIGFNQVTRTVVLAMYRMLEKELSYQIHYLMNMICQFKFM